MLPFSAWFARKEFTGSGGYNDLAKIAYPLILMSASNIIMQFADRKFLGNSSTEEMAAALPSGILYFTLFCLFLVSASFTGTIIAQLHGKGNPRECVRAAWSGFYFSIMAGAAILLILPVSGYVILKYSMSEILFPYALKYFISLTPSGVFACMGASLFAFFTGRGKTLPVAAVNIFGCLLNILLDWIMIFGKFGCPKMGISGAGLATSLCSFCGLAIVMVMFLSVDQKVYPTRTLRGLDWEYIRKLLKFGAPSGLQVLSDVGSFTLMILLVGKIGDDALAVSSVAFSINNLSFMPLMGISEATAILCGQFIGKKMKSSASKIPYRSLRIAGIYLFLTALVYWIFPDFLCSIFRPDEPAHGVLNFQEVVLESRKVLALAAVWNLLDMVRYVFGGALRGAGDTKAVCIINVFCAWVLGVPGIMILIHAFHTSVFWTWSYLTILSLIEGILVYLRFRSRQWRKINVVSNAEAK